MLICSGEILIGSTPQWYQKHRMMSTIFILIPSVIIIYQILGEEYMMKNFTKKSMEFEYKSIDKTDDKNIFI